MNIEWLKKLEGFPGCQLCRTGILQRYCLVCPPIPVEKKLTNEEIRALKVQLRYDAEAESIESNILPETRKYFADLNKEIKKEKEQNNEGI